MASQTTKENLINFSASRLNKYELSKFIGDYLMDYDKKALPFELNTEPARLTESLREAHRALSAAMNQVKAESQASKLREADNIRDTDWRSFYHSLKAQQFTRDETKKASYESLIQLVKPYKTITTLNYKVATAHYKQFLEHCKDEAYANHIQVLGLEEHVALLKDSQAAFEKVDALRSDSQLAAGREDVEELKKAVEKVYKDLVDYCALLGHLKDDSIYQEMIHILNRSRKQYAEMLSRRGKHTKKQPITTNTPTEVSEAPEEETD